MFKYLLLKTIYDISDVDVVERSRFDMSFKYFLEMTPEEVLRSLPKVKEKLNLLKETIEDTQDHYTLSKDSDARIGHKTGDSSFFGFKTHIAMIEERIITAAVVTSGEKGDGPELPALVETSLGNGIEVDTIIGDAAYSGKENLKLAGDKEKAKHRYKIEAKIVN